MPELKERFSLADEVGTPDLWREARRRAAASETPPRAVEWPPGIARRVAVGAVAFAVFAAAAVFAWDLSHPEQPSPAPVVDLAAELPEGWSELPPPPENRSGAATAWTGSQLLLWGGYEYVGSTEDPDAEGFVFDAAARRWEPLPASPLGGRSDAAFAWTGRELLIWGGWDGGFRDPPYFGDGAAFDPVAGTWRTFAPAPIGARSAFSVWTGEELIVWGSTERAVRRLDGAAYDPATDTWRTIADGPIDITDGSAVWTGQEMIVFGAALDENNHADTPTAVGAAYDPQADSWRELSPSDLSPQAMTAEWLGDELIAWDHDQASAAYDPIADAWQALPDVPLEFSECRPVTVATGRTVFGEFCGKTVVFAPKERAWHRAPMPAPDPQEGCCGVYEPVAAGDVVLVPSHWYGKALEAMDRRMLVYNPPEVVTTDARGEVLEPEPFIPQVERDGDRILMPITFPDGREGTLSYPIPLDLATLGLQPDVSYVWKENPPPRFPLRFLHDPNASIAEYVEGREPVGEVAGQIERIEVWKARGNDVERRFWLRFELPSWTVLVSVPDALTSAEQVASSLLLRETEGGFPVALASGPIELSAEAGEAEGPVLSIGSVEGIIQLFPESCSGSPSGELAASHQHFSRCFASRIFMTVAGDPPFVTAVSDGIEIEASWPAEPTPFVPDANVADGIAHAALTFPNGATATLVYRSTFGLVDYGVQPDDAWVLPNEVGPTPIAFVHGPAGVERNYVLGAEPVAHVPSSSGERLPVWQAVRISGQIAPSHWLVHRVGSWTVLVGLPGVRWAEEIGTSIVIHLDTDGMPWIETLGRIRPSTSAGEGGGAQLTIADRDPTPRSLLPASEFFLTVEMSPFGCDEGAESTGSNGRGDMFAVLCLGGGNVLAEINGDRQPVESLIEDVRIEDFVPSP
jgi:hypothetical protein